MNKIEQLLNQQKIHDSNYHLDIYHLPVIYKLKHFSFHYTKYLCKLTLIDNLEECKKFMIDTFIISLSFANTLNINLNNLDFKYQVTTNFVYESSNQIIQNYAKALLILTKALDAYDHIEEFSIRESLQVVPQDFINIVLSIISIFKWSTFETDLLLRYQEIRDKRLT